ncbi:putative F-box domain-containing protein [Helianthus anomalus]
MFLNPLFIFTSFFASSVRLLNRTAARMAECWSNMLPELLGEIIRRVEANDDRWPLRRNVVACGCVCKRWREVSREIVTGNITFPSCLKQFLFGV